MSVFSRILAPFKRKSSTPAETRSSLENPNNWLLDALNTTENWSGASVSDDTIKQIPAVWRCINLISSTVARLPIDIFVHDGDKSEKDRESALYDLLTYSISPLYTPFTFFETITAQLCINGNAYAHIVRNRAGEPTQLQIITEPVEVCVFEYKDPNSTTSGKYLVYKLQKSGAAYLQRDILHFKGFGDHPLIGLNPIQAQANTFGISLSSMEYIGKLYANGGFLTGILESDAQLNNEQRKNIALAFKGSYQGAKNAGKIAIVDHGFKFKAMSLKPSDIEYVKNQQFQIHEIARIYGVPPHKLFDLEKATMNNMEIQNSGFLETISTYCERIEHELRAKLTTNKNTYIRFNLYELSRGDMKVRADYYRSRMNTGSITPNEIRVLEGNNPSDQDGMNDYYLQVNMQKVKNFDSTQVREIKEI